MKRIIKLEPDGTIPNNILYAVEIVKEIPKLLPVKDNDGNEVYRGFKVDGGMTVIGSFYQIDMETDATIDKIEKEIKKLEQQKIKLLNNTHRFKLHTNK